MDDPTACPQCRRELPPDDRACPFCERQRRPLPLAPGPRIAPLMDALPAEEDRLTTRPTPRREPPAKRPRLNPEEIETPEVRSRAKGSMAFEIGMGLLCIVGGMAWFVGGLSFGMFFKYPVVLLIGGVGLIVDGVRRKVR